MRNSREGRFGRVVEAAEGGTAFLGEERRRTKDKTMAITVIGGHTLVHLYAYSFPVLATAMYADLGLLPIQAGILSAVRQLTGGLTSIGSGFFVDLFAHRSGQDLQLHHGFGCGYASVPAE